jgi:hypothetical protein
MLNGRFGWPPLGYIGGSVLQRLLDHPKRDTFEITALVRNADKAKLLNTLGVNTIVASLSDLDKLADFAAASDVVIHTVIMLPSSLVSSFVLSSLCRQTPMIKMLPEPFFVGRKRATTKLARFLLSSTLYVEIHALFLVGVDSRPHSQEQVMLFIVCHRER